MIGAEEGILAFRENLSVLRKRREDIVSGRNSILTELRNTRYIKNRNDGDYHEVILRGIQLVKITNDN